MSRNLAVLLALVFGGCGGAAPGAPSLTAEQLREGAVASTLDVLVGAVDLFALDPADPVAEVRVRGEPVTLFADLAPDGLGIVMTLEAEGACRTEALLELVHDPDKGIAIGGTLRTEADGVVVTATLDGVFAQPVADLPGLESGVVFTSGDVDLGVHAGDRLLATGTAALFGRSALVALSIRGASTEGEIDLGR
jgi:hypothetical protein